MSEETVVVGSAEDKAQRMARLDARFTQAIAEISDEGTFSPDQIALLNNAFMIIWWGIKEST